MRQDISSINRTLQDLNNQTHNQETQTIRQINQTDKHPLKNFSTGNKGVSIGNEGVQTDRQTIRQTDRHIQKFAQTPINPIKPEPPKTIDQLERLSEALDSLDDLKRNLRTQFKRLTNQEMLIFSTIYQLENQGDLVDYALISSVLNLSESSIRDHVKNIIKKGVPVDKIKQNNKKITLSIHMDLKKIASLETILELRDL